MNQNPRRYTYLASKRNVSVQKEAVAFTLNKTKRVKHPTTRVLGCQGDKNPTYHNISLSWYNWFSYDLLGLPHNRLGLIKDPPLKT